MIISPRRNKNSYSDVTVLIDIDDTIAGLCDAWCDWLNKKYGTTTTPEDITEWKIEKFYPTLTADQVFSPFHDEDFWNSVKPKDNAVEYVEKLINDGFDVYLCTSTNYLFIKQKFESVIKRYFPFIKWEKVIVSYNKAMIRADFLVDDGVHNLESFRGFKFLISRPHNKQYDAEKNFMIRVNDMKEAYLKIRDIADGMVKRS